MDSIFSTNCNLYESADHALRGVLRGLSEAPNIAAVTTGASKVKSGTQEELGHSFVIKNSRDRIVANEALTLDLPVAVARFVWMVSGNNRLADIAFYQEKVREFSDDGMIVPGSSYGLRIRQAHPGVDQLRGAISRLKADPKSRRAAVVIWSALDAVRESNDIPCAFGLFFHVRQEKLHTQIIMRSNNATVLLPFNMFEFTMLAEVIAAEIGVEMGQVRYTAASMHTYENMARLTEKIVATTTPKFSAPMPNMPPDVFPELEQLVKLEAEIRHGSFDIDDSSMSDWVDRARDRLSPYWAQLALLLLAHIARKNCSAHGREIIKAALDHPYRDLVKFGEPNTVQDDVSLVQDLFTTSGSGSNILNFPGSQMANAFRERVKEFEAKSGEKLSAIETLDLQEKIMGRLAARGSTLDGAISFDDLSKGLNEIRKGK